ncbi:hypothetical protein ACSLWF_22725, partial [Salmonella enterica]|uniref:hypothetical protein n=1 Tax=Salmonella enterica TaxID=28901 RepID=UPI003F1CA490
IKHNLQTEIIKDKRQKDQLQDIKKYNFQLTHNQKHSNRKKNQARTKTTKEVHIKDARMLDAPTISAVLGTSARRGGAG